MDTVTKNESQRDLVSFSKPKTSEEWVYVYGGGTFVVIFQQVWWPPPGQGQARMSIHECRDHSFTQQMLIELPLRAMPYAEYGGYSSEHSGHGPHPKVI